MCNKQRIRQIAFAVAAAGISCLQLSAAAAQKAIVWEPPYVDWPDNLPRSTVPQEKIKTLRVSDFDIALDETNLADAAKHFRASPGSKGDGGDFEEWICLGGIDSQGRWGIWLISSEINGGAIGGFEWRHLSSDESLDHRCRMLPRGSRIQLPIALGLGLSEKLARDALGQPTMAKTDALFYFHDHKGTVNGLVYTISNNLAVSFRDRAVWAIEVFKSSSD